ncbi:hypothetical protein ACP76Z_02555 [Vibrio cholerae]
MLLNCPVNTHAVRGLIRVGDVFVCTAQRSANSFANISRSVVAVEMEASAIAQTCHQFKVPFVVLCDFSMDVADKNSTVV